LGSHFESSGRLEPGRVSELAALQTFRNVADYDARDRLSLARAQAQVASAWSFVTAAKGILEATPDPASP
jgi:hypothetical protein